MTIKNKIILILSIIIMTACYGKTEGMNIVYASETEAVQTSENESGDISGFTYVNPLYKDVLAEEDIQSASNPAVAFYAFRNYETDETVISEQIREAMVNRETEINIYYRTKTKYTEEQLVGWVEQALEETENSNEGDYLRWNFGGFSVTGDYAREWGYYKYHFIYTMDYYTTWEQEEELERIIADALDELNIWDSSLSDYEKIEKIYHYVCAHVSYDFEHLTDENYILQYTAYAAMINKTAVCQGYATLLYRMMEEAGIDCRVISGISSGEAHGWNLVGLDGTYYFVDSTWDAGKTKFTYFLKGTQDFNNHVADSDFLDEYNIAQTAYVVGNTSPIEPIDPVEPVDPIDPIQVLPFIDVHEEHWFYDSVGFVYENGIMTGLDEDSFGPMESLSRAQFAVILYRMTVDHTVSDIARNTDSQDILSGHLASDVPCTVSQGTEAAPEVSYEAVFADVEDGLWYTDAVLWAYDAGIITGYESGNFGPADLITREQLATMLYRYAKYCDYDTIEKISLDAFIDSNKVTDFAQEPMAWIVASGILTGKDEGTRLAPQDDTARAECAAMITRLLN